MSGGHGERTHKKYSPSQSERFLKCPGSVALLERTPARTDSPYAIEGHKAHEIIDAALTNGIRRAVQAHKEYTDFPLRGEAFEQEFYTAIQICLNYVYGILDEHSDAQLYCEREIHVPLEALPGEADGYGDIAIWIPSIRQLYVIDYKHGAGVTKDVVGNTQALQYAAGTLYGDNAIIDPMDVTTVTLVIVQPRGFHADGYIREYDLTPFEVFEYLDVLEAGVRTCEKPNAPLVPGEWCSNTFCEARTTCPAREAMLVAPLAAAGQALQSMMEVRAPSLPDPKGLDVNRLSYIYQLAPMIRKFLDEVEGHIFELSRDGYRVPGVKVVETQARRRWYYSEQETLQKLAALSGENILDLMTVKVINITEAEKLVVEKYKSTVGRGKKKLAAENARKSFAYLTIKESSGSLTLATEDDPRPAVNVPAAAFKQVAGLVPSPQAAETGELRNDDDHNA